VAAEAGVALAAAQVVAVALVAVGKAYKLYFSLIIITF
jgi:hypothetical protein